MCALKRIYIKSKAAPHSFIVVRQRESLKKFSTENKNGMAFHPKIEIFNFKKDKFFKETHNLHTKKFL